MIIEIALGTLGSILAAAVVIVAAYHWVPAGHGARRLAKGAELSDGSCFHRHTVGDFLVHGANPQGAVR
jgi:hypothetical protein